MKLREIVRDDGEHSPKLVSVCVGTISNPKETSKIMKFLSTILPSSEFKLDHLKRIRKIGKALQAIICIKPMFDSLDSGLKQEIMSLFGGSDSAILHLDLPAKGPGSNAEYQWSNGIWPTIFHSRCSLETERKLRELAPEEEAQMVRGVELAKNDFLQQESGL
eukprot:CAMPEP_0194718858 /NCGR_PEP_ID=MMETSP0296-20130528/10388_1 /TAXON_ID=39354 /ORGANISM="Heterosigma akashiwo, Strain CCMP2393" /LENGTH=162 /DNA_ID=CAMNT_0039620353 /DNA_START=61 /DNA_END=545 /DNA_ORIENTATION=-